MKALRIAALSVLTVCCTAMLAGIAFSEEIKAKIKSIDTPKNTVVVSEATKGEDLTIIVEDKTAVDQLQSGKIKVGNKAKIKYESKNGKNVATYFKKLPGC